ncbi:hypothetical protein ZWY2020_005961 [Hordeum vulgare]|nr:hypothetical protein ZWY2020_005961 [Hordeum vulgare]
MDQSIAWQKAMQDLAGNNQEIREQLREITGWFPSIEMMRNHARGLIKKWGMAVGEGTRPTIERSRSSRTTISRVELGYIYFIEPRVIPVRFCLVYSPYFLKLGVHRLCGKLNTPAHLTEEMCFYQN